MVRCLLRVALFLAPVMAVAAPAAPSQTKTGVPLIAPLISGPIAVPVIIPANGIALFTYITRSLFWLQEVAVGMVMLWMIFAGIMIMISGNDQGKRTEAKDHMVAAIIGLLMLFLLGFVLSMLNNLFFIE